MALAPEFPIPTPRLALRPLSRADTPALLAYRSLPEVCRYVPFEPMDAAAVEQRFAGGWASTRIDAEGDHLTLGIEHRESGMLIGDLVLMYVSARHRTAELGWVLNPHYSGNGYATEGAAALLELAFGGLGVHRCVARIDARNGPSLGVARRLGMRQEAHLVENEWFKGAWSDEIDFAILDREWAARGD